MRKSVILLSLVSMASLLLSYSCKNADSKKEEVKDVTGVWMVDSISTRFYPTDSVALTVFSDTLSQKVIFQDKLYETVVRHNGDTISKCKMAYTLKGDTISYLESNNEVLMEEYIVSISDSTMVTQSAILYKNKTADLNTTYYSRDKSMAQDGIVPQKVKISAPEQ